MAKRNSQGMRNFESAANTTARAADKAAVSLFKYATTDHSGMPKALSNMPKMGFLDTIGFIFRQFLFTVASAVLTGVLFFLLIGAIAYIF